jgi:hypothetical protein
VLIKVSDSFLKSWDNTVFFVIGWEYDAQADFGRFNVASIGSGIGFGGLNGLLAGLALCKPAVVPARQRLRLCSSGRMACDILLLGGVNGTRLWGDEMENDIELERSA